MRTMGAEPTSQPRRAGLIRLPYLYGTASALVFGQLFFPKFDTQVALLAAFATFGVGFLARPIGGLEFGHLR